VHDSGEVFRVSPMTEAKWLVCDDCQAMRKFVTPRISARKLRLHWRASIGAENVARVAFLRCIVGPLPFRSLNLDPSWRPSAVFELANEIYWYLAFDALPVLGDALEEAGCTNADILSHCRSPGPHVRGCWVVDLVLGKQ